MHTCFLFWFGCVGIGFDWSSTTRPEEISEKIEDENILRDRSTEVIYNSKNIKILFIFWLLLLEIILLAVVFPDDIEPVRPILIILIV